MQDITHTAPKEETKEWWYYQVRQDCIHEHWRKNSYEHKRGITYAIYSAKSH